jgi:uncharacterized protein DUF4058
MPVHDWTLVEAGIFHDFNVAWIPEIRKVLNGGLLPDGYYALIEQHVGKSIPDLLTLHGSPPPPQGRFPLPPDTGGTAVAEAPPRVRRRQTLEPAALARRRSLAIRHVSGHRLIAILEILSTANKDRKENLQALAQKVASALDFGVHVLLVDLFPPGPHDPQGIHGFIRQELDLSEDVYDLPSNEPLTLASYAVNFTSAIDIYLEHLAPGAVIPEMPLFIRPDKYVNVPLESTYESAYSGMPEFWRNVLEGKTA